jgi:hypothetical protein
MNRLRRTIRHVGDFKFSAVDLAGALAFIALAFSLPMAFLSLRSRRMVRDPRHVDSQQKSYFATMPKAEIDETIRGIADTMAQEIGQAGVVPSTSTTLPSNITASPQPQTVTVDSTSNMFPGESLHVDYTSASYETVTVAAISNSTSFTAVFSKNHGAGAVVWAGGIFPQGILSSSTGDVLRLVGDINGDGTLVYEEYACDATAGTFSRSITPIGATSKNSAVILVQGLTSNPDGTACFTYSAATSSGYTFVTNVGFTVTIRSLEIDPQAGSYATITKSFQNLSPRNIKAALALAQAGMTAPLQPTPPGVPML